MLHHRKVTIELMVNTETPLLAMLQLEQAIKDQEFKDKLGLIVLVKLRDEPVKWSQE